MKGDKIILKRGLLICGSLLLCLCLFFSGDSLGYERGLSLGYHLGLNEFWSPKTPGEEITIAQAIQYLGRASESHLYYINQPEKLMERSIKGVPGDIEFHQGCVDRYQAIINLLNSTK